MPTRLVLLALTVFASACSPDLGGAPDGDSAWVVTPPVDTSDVLAVVDAMVCIGIGDCSSRLHPMIGMRIDTTGVW
ncbi:MAG: hypothetical protein H6734_12325 [Alphaproteobacteria bacterium]|nr:hypothetical protein [Alphaproteobacteria bacterium]